MKNASVTYIRGIYSGIQRAYIPLLEQLAVPILLMVGANVIDYATG